MSERANVFLPKNFILLNYKIKFSFIQYESDLGDISSKIKI